MKISYVTTYNALDIHQWSGTGYYIAKALQHQNNEVDFIGNLVPWEANLFKAKKLLYKLAGKKYLWDREPYLAKRYAEQVLLKLKLSSDIIFSPGSSPIALINSSRPKVFYTDATFAGLLNYYEGFSNLCEETIKKGNLLEQNALDSCSMAIYSSHWAAESALNNYNVDSSKVKVVPFGANLESNRTIDDIKTLLKNKSKVKCNLLFLAVEWERKGGSLAVEVAKLLNEFGLPTEIHIAGIKETFVKKFPSFVKSHGFISKSTEEGKGKIASLIAQSHFLIIPSKADCTPIVFSEASSYGLPSISTNTGGIPTVIQNNVNGFTFDLNKNAQDYARYIFETFKNQKEYERLVLSTFNDYNKRLNWQVAGKSIKDLISQL